MWLTDYLDKGASLGADAACLTMGPLSLSYGEVQRLSYRVARALDQQYILCPLLVRFICLCRGGASGTTLFDVRTDPQMNTLPETDMNST